MGMILHPKVTVDEVLNDGGTPAAGGIAAACGPVAIKALSLLALRFGQICWVVPEDAGRPNWQRLARGNGCGSHGLCARLY